MSARTSGQGGRRGTAAADGPDGRAGVVRYDVVVPTVGRPSLHRTLAALATAGADDPHAPGQVVVVDDRGPAAATTDPLRDLPDVGGRPPRVVVGGGRGPAAARNVGWRCATAPWVAFLDDDVLPSPTWTADLVADLQACEAGTAGSQGRVVVPPAPGRPTDWARSTAGLQTARWITADMAYRRTALLAAGGFDERFPRAYREDADLALRVQEAGWSLARGRRRVEHPVRPAGDLVSVRVQAGNADDVLMRRLHGRDWRTRAGAPPGRLRWHLATVGAAATAVASTVAGRRGLASGAGAAWAGLTLDLL
ncbi:glycosyltransferase family 2 protein, partial [Thalassiella azotivora]